jgi:hypothetical protein
MKNLKNLFIAAIAGATLFTSCKKDDSLLATSAGAATTDATKSSLPSVGGFLHYNIATINSKPGDLVNFRAGSINAISLRLDATWDAGNAEKLITLQKQTAVVQWQLYQPIDLGAINLQNGSYHTFKFTVALLPQGSVYALTLDGNYSAFSDPNRVPAKTTAYAQRPVHIFVNNAIAFTGEYALPLLINNPDYYTLTFYLSPNDLMGGITPAMLDHATTTNDNIYITVDSNPTLYKQILLNLTNNLRVTVAVKNLLPAV